LTPANAAGDANVSRDDDRSLANAVVQRGDPRAFRLLYDRHTPALYGLALRYTHGDAPAAEDAVQDAWIRGVSRLGTFRWESALPTWLSAIVVRVVFESRKRAERDADTDELTDEGADDSRLNGVLDRTDLERAIAALPRGYRDVLLLHDVEGYTHAEIAGLLSIADGTSKSQLSRARAAVRRALTQPTGTD
jgi:RNA polymerase sigma-70 factor (ECF subfamily)